MYEMEILVCLLYSFAKSWPARSLNTSAMWPYSMLSRWAEQYDAFILAVDPKLNI